MWVMKMRIETDSIRRIIIITRKSTIIRDFATESADGSKPKTHPVTTRAVQSKLEKKARKSFVERITIFIIKVRVI